MLFLSWFEFRGSAIAPSLIGVGAASVDFQVGTGRMPVADLSVQIMRKRPVYDEKETAALAAYVASLAPGPEIPTEASSITNAMEVLPKVANFSH